MAQLATLGTTDPFSQCAAESYKKKDPEIDILTTHSTVQSVFRAVGEQNTFGLLPLENMIDGHVIQVLELLLQSNCTIIDELIIPVYYSLCSNARHERDISTLYTSYRSRMECSEYIATLQSVDIVQVADTNEALAKLDEHSRTSAALIPYCHISRDRFTSYIENCNDYSDNRTRYIVIGDQEQPFQPDKNYKTSMVILEAEDRPGVLGDILTAFSSRAINLSSIISRPTREHIGTYHFFIDCSGYVLTKEMREALDVIHKLGHIKLLGSYPAAEFTPEQGKPAPANEIPSMRENPLHPSSRAPRISIAAGQGPYRNTLNALADFNLSPVKGKKVLLKPNIGRIAEPYSGVVTNPQVVAAAVDAFRAAGAEVAIGESPITGIDLEEAYEKSGITFIARERNCPLIDMDKRKPIDIEIRDGVAIKRLKVCADVFDYDFIVSIPVMKTHMHTVATLSVKNMKGCLWRRSKVELHMLPRVPFIDDKPLNIAIADTASVLKPHFVIIDGTVGMEGLGPSAGEPHSLDLVIAGNNAIATDAVACTIMGIDPKNVPHLRIAAERGYGSIDPESYFVTNPEWKSLSQPFAPVPESLSMQFPNVKILDEQSCSACQSTVLLFMKRFGDQLSEYFPDNKKLTIAIGKGHTGVPPNTICIGNCTRRFRDAGIYVPGCPPVASNIMATLKKQKEQQKP